MDFARRSAGNLGTLGHRHLPAGSSRVCCQAAWLHQVLGSAMLQGMVKFPAGILRPGAVMVVSEESPAHHWCAVVRFLSSLLVSCSAVVNLGHSCFSSNCVSGIICTQNCSLLLLPEHPQQQHVLNKLRKELLPRWWGYFQRDRNSSCPAYPPQQEHVSIEVTVGGVEMLCTRAAIPCFPQCATVSISAVVCFQTNS